MFLLLLKVGDAMPKIYKNVSELVGRTPLLELGNLGKLYNVNAHIFAKLEGFNPAGSAKDRVAKAMLDEAERQGKINSDTVIIEPTSGNTGIGLASIGVARGLKVIIVMPDTMSAERMALMKAYGAKLYLSDGKKGMAGAIELANELAKKYPNSFIPSQFENPTNPKAHFETTGPEIWEDTEGAVDIFVAGVGTGGTITGVGEFLKYKNKDIKIIAVEPDDSPILSGGKPGPHKLQGIGAGFVPKILNTEIYDEVLTITDSDAYELAKNCAKCEGILVGISSGAALSAAISLAKRPENKDKNIVVLLPDTGERYLSTELFNN